DHRHDFVGDLAEPEEASEEADGERQKPGQDAFHAVGGGADIAGGDGDDRVDEGGDDLDDLRDLLHEHHDGVVDRNDRRDKAGTGNEHGDQLGDGFFHDGFDDEFGDATDDLILEIVELLLDQLPGRGGAAFHQSNDGVEGRFELRHDRF